jgi:hypothetical protein
MDVAFVLYRTRDAALNLGGSRRTFRGQILSIDRRTLSRDYSLAISSLSLGDPILRPDGADSRAQRRRSNLIHVNETR